MEDGIYFARMLEHIMNTFTESNLNHQANAQSKDSNKQYP